MNTARCGPNPTPTKNSRVSPEGLPFVNVTAEVHFPIRTHPPAQGVPSDLVTDGHKMVGAITLYCPYLGALFWRQKKIQTQTE